MTNRSRARLCGFSLFDFEDHDGKYLALIMKGKRPITGGLYKTKNARKLTDTILKPKFTGSQASKKSNEQRSKFSRLTHKAKSHCEISSQLSQTIKIPSIETKIQDPMKPGISVSTEQLYEKDSYGTVVYWCIYVN